MAVTLLLVVVTLFVGLCLWVLLKPSKTSRAARAIPGPDTVPLFGNALMLKWNAADLYEQMMGWACDEYKDATVWKILMGPVLWLCVNRAESVEILLSSSKHITKSGQYDSLLPWLGTGLLTSTGEKWKKRRKLLTPTFHFNILNDFLLVFNDQAAIFVEKIDKKEGKGPFNIFNYVTFCVLDIICETAMGHSMHAQDQSDSEYVRAIYKASELIHQRQKSPWLWNDLIYSLLPSGRQFSKCLKVLQGATKQVIQERTKELEEQLQAASSNQISSEELKAEDLFSGKKKRLAFLDMLLYVGRGEVSSSDVQEEVDTFMFEGHDTTAAGINWAIHLIGSHPEVQKRLHEEMDQIFGDSNRDVTMDDVRDMKYLECVIKESLRLFPSVPMFARYTSEDCVIGGYEIPKGSTGVVLTTALHRDPKYFPDPDKFDPERFTKENSLGRHPFAYVPFSAGPRNCIGQKFAMIEEKVLLSSILRRFNITATQRREELRPAVELILRPENGIWVELKHR